MEYKTRSGRNVKPPERYEPNEICNDDYDDDEYDTDMVTDSDIEDESESDSDSESGDEDDDLDGFVVDDDDES